MTPSTPAKTGLRSAVTPSSFPPGRPGGNSAEGQRGALFVLSSIRRHWLLALGLFVVLVGGGAFVLRDKATPVYSAQSVVYVSPKFPKVLNNDSEVERPYDSYFQDQIQTVSRYDIVADAISKLPAKVRQQTGPPSPVEIAKLQRALDVQRIGTSYQMSIGLQRSSPNGLADIVNAVTNSYVERSRNEEFYGLGDRLNTLRQERTRLREQMDSSLAEQADLMQRLGVAAVSTGDGSPNPYDTSSNSLRNQLNLARMQRAAAEAQLETSLTGNAPSDANGANGQDATSDDAVSADPGLVTMWSTLNNRRALLLQEMAGVSADHPIYQKDQDELSSIDSVMGDLKRKAAAQLQSKLRRDVERSRMVELKLTQQLTESTENAAAAAPKFQRAIELGPEIESRQKAYEAVDDRIRDLELESTSPGSVHVSTKALTPASPEPSKLPLYAIALLLGSLGCALAVVAAIDFVDNRIYAPQDIERVAGFHPIGTLLDADEFSERAIDEHYFRLAAGIDDAVRNGGARSFLFTSTTHGVGTTTIVERLSEELRALDLRCRTIRVAGSAGRASSVRGGLPRSALLLQGWGDNLPQAALEEGGHGGLPADQMEEAASPGTTAEQALRHAGVGYDVVLIDADPLPISANTEYLARVADATVLVVKAGTTTMHELHRGAKILERLQVAGVAVVLNKIRLQRADRDLRRDLRSCLRPRGTDISVESASIVAPHVAVRQREAGASSFRAVV